jgi:hypothetical protein
VIAALKKEPMRLIRLADLAVLHVAPEMPQAPRPVVVFMDTTDDKGAWRTRRSIRSTAKVRAQRAAVSSRREARTPAKPNPAKPAIIMIHVLGSGTVPLVKEASSFA